MMNYLNRTSFSRELSVQGNCRDIIGILDSNYNKIVSYGYDAWGKLLSIKDNEGNIINDNNIGIEGSVKEKSLGLSFELINYDDGLENPMAMPSEVWHDENTLKTTTIGFHKEIVGNVNKDSELSNDGIFIGVSFEAFLVVGGRIKIGFIVGG